MCKTRTTSANFQPLAAIIHCPINMNLRIKFQNNDDIIRGVIIIAIISFLSWAFINSCNEEKKLERSFKFTLAEITGFERSAEGTPYINYQYTVNDKEFYGYFTRIREFEYIKVGDKFLVKYFPKDPNIGRIQTDYPIFSSFKNAPRDGWNEIPDSIISIRTY